MEENVLGVILERRSGSREYAGHGEKTQEQGSYRDTAVWGAGHPRPRARALNTGWGVMQRELSGSGQGQCTPGPRAPERQDNHTDGPSQHPRASAGQAQEGQGCWRKQASRQEEGSAGHPPWDGAIQRARSEGQRGWEGRQGHFTGETNERVGSSCDPREGGYLRGPRACCQLLSWRGRRGPSMPTSVPLLPITAHASPCMAPLLSWGSL